MRGLGGGGEMEEGEGEGGFTGEVDGVERATINGGRGLTSGLGGEECG